MHVAILNYVYNDHHGTPEALDRASVAHTCWEEGLALAGARVSVLQRSSRAAVVERSGVTYHFVADRHDPFLRMRQVPWRLHRIAQRLRPDVVHVQGMLFPLQARLAHTMLESPVVVQDHASVPMPGWRGWLQRWGLHRMDGFLFAARALAEPWLARRIIPSPDRVFEIMEGSVWFERKPRAEARQRTGLSGEPLLLWVGRLDANKDPLTVLDGVERLLAHAPAARLAMLYSDEALLPQVRARLAQGDRLGRAVTLVGRVPHEEMPWYYSSADLFVLGSHHEGSGYALVEALACGLVPLVTDIPSFRMMTDGGRVGALWPIEDAAGLVAAAQRLLRQPLAPQGEAARRFFDARLSIPAIGRQAIEIYQATLDQRLTDRTAARPLGGDSSVRR